MKKRYAVFAATFLVSPATALAFDIGGGGGGILGGLTMFLQEVIDWVTGPFGAAFAGFAIIGALVAWNRSPGNSEWLGKMVRAACTAIGVFGIGVVVEWLRSFV